MTLNQAIKTLNIEGRRLTVPSVRKLTGIKSDTVIRAAIDKFKADLSRKEKEKEGTGPYMEAVEFLGGKMRHTYCSDDLDIWTIKF